MKTHSVLIVDDITSNIQIIDNYLEEDEKDYQVMSAINGKMAYEIIQKRLPDLVITDWEMPEMNGLELIANLKSNPLTKKIPCIVVTGMRTLAEDLKKALGAGAVDFVRKPINKLELLARVDSVLKLSDAYKELEDQKNRELSMKTLQVSQKNQVLIQIEEKLKKFLEGLTPETRIGGKEILKLIVEQTNLDDEWENFKLHFEQVHPDFFHYLQDNYNLTQNDLKWCAYIRIGLSTKEIANLLHVDYAGARVNKTRLKKKIALTAEQDLTSFLQNI